MLLTSMASGFLPMPRTSSARPIAVPSWDHVAVEAIEDRRARCSRRRVTPLGGRKEDHVSVGVPGSEAQERDVDVPARLADEGLVLVEVDHGVGRQAHLAPQLVETHPAGRTAALGRELIEHP